MEIQDLHYYVKRWDMSRNEFVDNDVFSYFRVQKGIAIYVAEGYEPLFLPEESDREDAAFNFIFGELYARVEYEFCISPLFGELDWAKTDVYTFFLKPNQKMLMEMVKSVSKESAEKWLKENDNRIKLK